MTQETISYVCKPCLVCGERQVLELPKAERDYWYDNECLVQEAFPDMPKDQREMLITGTHPACWIELFPVDDHFLYGTQVLS